MHLLLYAIIIIITLIERCCRIFFQSRHWYFEVKDKKTTWLSWLFLSCIEFHFEMWKFNVVFCIWSYPIKMCKYAHGRFTFSTLSSMHDCRTSGKCPLNQQFLSFAFWFVRVLAAVWPNFSCFTGFTVTHCSDCCFGQMLPNLVLKLSIIYKL